MCIRDRAQITVLTTIVTPTIRTKGISIAFAFIIATMLIPEVVTARPLYDFMRAVGLYDTYPGLIILYISAVLPFTVLILKNFASRCV